MTHQEINKRIVQLKGLTATYNDYDAYALVEGLKLTPVLKNWAQDIKDAWELFDDMDYFTTLTKVSDHGEPVWVVELEAKDICAMSAKAPEAICLAYISWKVMDGKNADNS